MSVVIVDDDAQIRTALCAVVQGAGLQVLGQASDGDEALALVELVNPQIVVLDGRMPTADGLVTTQRLTAQHPKVKVIAHTSDPEMAKQMLLLGAVGSVEKGSQELSRVLVALSEKPGDERRRR